MAEEGSRQENAPTGCLLLIGLFLVISIMFVMPQGKTKPEQHTPEEIKIAQENIWIEKGKAAALEKMKDADSAKFRNVFLHRAQDNIPMTCGEVNSRNGFGGYTGFQRFVSGGKPELTFFEEQIKDFPVVWRQMCE